MSRVYQLLVCQPECLLLCVTGVQRVRCVGPKTLRYVDQTVSLCVSVVVGFLMHLTCKRCKRCCVRKLDDLDENIGRSFII